ncbi:hypothetical protein [Nocardia blacklockiae]|uniref:hypothetical protein n=1 Tax=Nocardia blacklockiae TaxID=480036 RepID=UPI001893ABCF|nr:hypothetical protein [Nocardia blacklockiae]MBF6175906.1 hypothetical protein [Nocardia blacklockiae]
MTTILPAPITGNARAAYLRTMLQVDGWSTGGFGIVLLAAGPLLHGPLGLPSTWSIPFGIGMLGGAAALLLIAGYPDIPRELALTVVAANTLSAAVMLVLVFVGAMPLTGWGIAFMLIGAAVVTAFAALEFIGLRRTLSLRP